MATTGVDAAVKTLLECDEMSKKLSPQTKSISARSSASKSVIAQHMLANKSRFKQIGNNRYVVLKQTRKKPSRNNELLAVVVTNFAKKCLNRQLSDDERAAFLEELEKAESTLGDVTWTVQIQNSKPVASLLV